MVASPFGGVNIEEVARDSPSRIFKDAVDITSGEIVYCDHCLLFIGTNDTVCHWFTRLHVLVCIVHVL